MTSPPPKLPYYEWCIIILFSAIMLALAGLAFGRQQSTPVSYAPPEPPPSALQVSIEGEVAKPGVYQLPLDATLRQLIEKGEPLAEADLSQLNPRKKLFDGQTIRIPRKRWITITVEGAVQEPGSYKILSGTRYQELTNQLQLSPEADLNAIRKKKRFLKDGETIRIPTKKDKGKGKGKAQETRAKNKKEKAAKEQKDVKDQKDIKD